MVTDMDIGLNIPGTFLLVILEKLLVVIGEVDIYPRPATIPPVTHVTMLDCFVYLVLLFMLMILFLETNEVIVGVMVQYM